MTAPSDLGGPNFFTKSGYRCRLDAIGDFSRDANRPDVFRFAAWLGEKFGCHGAIALGCGQSESAMQILQPLQLTFVDFGESAARFREVHPAAEVIEHDFSESPIRLSRREQVAQSVVICSDVFEFLPNPLPLLESIRDLMRDSPVAILAASERDRIRGPEHMGPPLDPRRVRLWNLSEFEKLLKHAGLNVAFVGLAAQDDRDRGKKTIVAVVRPQGTETIRAAPPDYRVCASICAYNEEDMIAATLEHLTSQGIEVHLVDNWSTDQTVERAEPFLGRGLHSITKFPGPGPSAAFDLHQWLQQVEERSYSSGADWWMHYDADEIRQSPWPRIRLRDALYRVEQEGFNAVDQTSLVFRPTTRVPVMAGEVNRFAWFEFGKRPGHFQQIKAWKPTVARARLADSGGHSAEFPGRRVYPFKFLLRHYPVRSPEQGLRKILAERKPRWEDEKKERGWHTHYDHIDRDHNFLADPDDLMEFRQDSFHSEFLIERLSGIGIDRA